MQTRHESAIGLFGPLRLRGPDGEIRLPGGRQRLLLERFCLSPNVAVSSHELWEVGWGRPAADIDTKAVQVAVSRLRLALPPQVLLRATADASGFVLEAPIDAIDVLHFEQLAAAALAGDTSDARAEIEAAAALAIEPPFVGFAESPLLAERRERLEQFRDTVLEAVAAIQPMAPAASHGDGRGDEPAPPAPPVRVGTVWRHIASELAEVAGGSVVCVVAPSGSGKSTLLEQVASVSERSVWLTLRDGYAEPARFTRDLVTAIRVAVPDFPAEDHIADTISPSLLRRDRFVEQLARSGPMSLVIDDFHLVTNIELLQWFTYVGRSLPPNARLFVGSRTPPAIGLSRLRVSRRLVEVDVRQMRFDAQETIELFDTFGLQIDVESSLQLIRQTNGWVAALVLMGIAGSRYGFINLPMTAGGLDVERFLVEEVLDDLPHQMREFLFESALLDAFDDELLVAVLDRPDAAANLRNATDRGLFIEPADQPSMWRCHRLFRDTLLHHGARRLTVERRAEIHRRAAGALIARGDDDFAIGHLAAVGDHDELIRVIAGDAGRSHSVDSSPVLQAWLNGQQATLRRWLQLLPSEAIERATGAIGLAVAVAIDDGDAAALSRLYRVLQHRHPIDEPPSPGVAAIIGPAALYLGDVDAAHEILRHGVERAASGRWRGSLVEYLLNCTFTEVLLVQDRRRQAGSQAMVSLELALRLGLRRHVAFLHTVLALVALFDNRDGDAVRHHAEALAADELVIGTHEIPYLASLDALMMMRHGDDDNAASTLLTAVTGPRFTAHLLPAALPMALLAGIEARAGAEIAARSHLESAERLLHFATGARLFERIAAAARRRQLAIPVLIDRDLAWRERLSDRERTVLRLLHGQLTLREIAVELYVSVNTVKSHTQSLYRKLGVSTREEAIKASTGVPLSSAPLSSSSR